MERKPQSKDIFLHQEGKLDLETLEASPAALDISKLTFELINISSKSFFVIEKLSLKLNKSGYLFIERFIVDNKNREGNNLLISYNELLKRIKL